MRHHLAVGRFLVVASTTVFLIVPARAFEAHEHRAMGNLAYELALNHHQTLKNHQHANGGADPVIPLTPGEWAAIANFSRPPGPDDRLAGSYGQIATCVDDFLIPEKMFNLGGGKKQRFWFPEKRSEVRLEEDRCYGRTGTPISRKGGTIAAGHSNHNHFQDDLLVALNMHHSAAIAIAASVKREGNTREVGYLFGALAMNAIADHYLQDFFAPGHIVTARANLTDTLSNSTHDLANEDGIYYQITQSTAKLILALAPAFNQHVRDGLCLRPPAQLGDFDKLGNSNPETACLQMIDNILNNFPGQVLLKGDARLWRLDEEGLRQRILMLAVEAQSILDVIEAYEGQPTNSFQDITWEFSAPEKKGQGWIEKLRVPKQDRKVTASFGYGEYKLATIDASGISQAPSATAEVPFHIPDFSPLIGAQIARESMFNGDRYGRSALTVYLSPKCYFCFQKDGIPNLIPSFGVIYMSEDPFHAWGGEARASVIVPNTESTLSVYLRKTRYTDGQFQRWGTGSGVRLEQGFTSFYSLFLGIGKDYGQTAAGSLERRWMFFAGLNFTIPWIHVKKMIKDHNEKNNAAPVSPST